MSAKEIKAPMRRFVGDWKAAVTVFIIINILMFVIVDITAQPFFERLLLDLSAFCLSVIAFFFIVAKRLIPSAPSRLWVKFTGIVLAILVIFALWGLAASALIGTTEDNVFRLPDMLYSSLLRLMVVEWILFIVSVFFTSADFVHAISMIIMLFTRSLFCSAQLQ